MPAEQPLWHKLYFSPPYTELARIVGYNGMPVATVLDDAKHLADKFGRIRMEQVAKELLKIDDSTTPATARLTDEARRLAWQLLGPPPEHAEYKHFKSKDPWIPPWARTSEKPIPAQEREPRSKKRTKKKKGESYGPASNVGPDAASVG